MTKRVDPALLARTAVPWERYADGDAWEITPGDLPVSPRRAMKMAHSWASRRNLKAEGRVRGDKLVVRFTPRLSVSVSFPDLHVTEGAYVR